jgi:hypothetical protein
MKITRSLALVAGASLILGTLAFARPAAAEDVAPIDWMQAMHESPAMVQMRDQMPAGAQQRCDQMHDQMTKWFEQNGGQMPGGMMSPGSNGGMMSGSSGGMMSS